MDKESNAPPLKPLEWVGSSRADLLEFPSSVRRIVGYALHVAQTGEKAPQAKPLRGFGGAGVLEVVAYHGGGAYRAVYTVRFPKAVYVLHSFQKKSKSGIATPRADVALIEQRLRAASEQYQQQYEQR